MDEGNQFLQELYQMADAEVAAAGPQCQASGRCCRFKEWGHVLYLSKLEADYLLAHAPEYDQPVSSDYCPFQVDNLCTAREPRPLGCRVYFCDSDYQETGNLITEKYLQKIKAFAADKGMEWQYGPLHFFLNESNPASLPSIESPKKMELPVVPDPLP